MVSYDKRAVAPLSIFLREFKGTIRGGIREHTQLVRQVLGQPLITRMSRGSHTQDVLLATCYLH
jgi:hypothetical protein